MPLRRQPVKPSVSPERAVGLDAEELRRRIEAHLQRHAQAGEAAAVAVEEIVVNEQSGQMTVKKEKISVRPRPARPAAELAGELVFGLPVEWYLRLAWLAAVILAGLKIILMLQAGRSAALTSTWWTLPLLILAGGAVGYLAGRQGAGVAQAIVSGVTAGALAGIIVAVFRLGWTWRLVAIFNLIVEPAYFALAAAVGAAAAGYLYRRFKH